jgi:uncharacterized protein YceH (UPF0502 family)
VLVGSAAVDVSTKDLTAEELRVLGSLVEKELTTPEQYPLTLNALTLACNQKSSRDPVVSLREQTVEAAVTGAKTKGFARFVHPSHGRSVVRYAHTMTEALGLSTRQIALIAVLLLRGPQTPGELRARTERMAEFEDLEDLERELARLSGLEVPLVERLPRRPGQSQDRYRHLLGDLTAPVGASESPDREYISDRFVTPSQLPRPTPRPTTPPDAPDIRRELADLRAEVAELREQLDELRRSLGD